MPPVTLVSNEYITVDYRPEEHLIHHTIHQPIGSEQAQVFMDALSAGSQALKKYGVTKWLSDDRKNGPLPPEILQWGIDVWQPMTIADGWQYWANIVPTELAAAGTLIPIIENLHRLGLKMRVFTTVEDALTWLTEG